jgi:hypothetical protein
LEREVGSEMKKQKLAVIIGGVISLLLVVVTAIITISGINAASFNRQEMLSTSSRLASFYDRNPFPNDENIKAEEGKKEVLQAQYEALLVAVSTNAIVIEGDHSPGSFRLKCEETIAELRRTAPKSESGESVIPPDFYFGFDRYDPSKGGAPAAKNHVPRLLRQLKMVDKLVRTLYASGVMKIELVRREEFDIGSASPVDTDSSSRRSRRRASAATDSSGFSLDMDPVSFEEAPVELDCQRFGFVFIAREASLLATLNAINAMWPFAQVSGLQLEKVGTDVVFPAKVEDKPKADAPLAASGIKTPPPGRTSRIISGALREAPTKVQMTVDVFTFGSSIPREGNDNDETVEEME